MLIATIPVIVTVLGLMMHMMSSRAKVAELGRLMFVVGLLVSLLALGHTGSIRVLP